jgi:alkylation response protein AidB-like acyl-CoA dehydrogenase
MISEKLSTILKTIRQFVQEELVPLEKVFIVRPFRELIPRLKEKRDRVKKLGLWAPQLPAKVGGLGLSLTEFARVSEELGRTPMGHYVFNCQAPDAGNLEILMEYGTPEQQEKWMQPLVRGDIRSCFSMTEPEFAGSNPTWMQTTAVKDGKDYLLNGHKWFTSAADGATFAIVMAITNPDAASPHQRASQIIVPTNAPGFKLVRNISVMGHAGEDYPSHSEILYENCRVPQTNLLGEEGKGFAIAQQRLGPGRIHHCMRWIGICERAFELMCQRAANRQLSPDQFLGMRQIIQEWIAESRAEILASRLMVLHTAEKIDRESTRAARVEVSLIKFYVANVMQKVLDRAIQVHGALGLTDDSLLSHWYRHERGARIYDGPDEVHKTVVARMILKQHGLDIST